MLQSKKKAGGRLAPARTASPRGVATDLLARAQSDKPNTQITPPSGTSFFQPVRLLIKPCWNAGSTPQPETTATYCLPSTANDDGGAVMPEFVPISHNTLPDFASNARNLRSLVPPAKIRPPPVVSSGPHIIDSAKVWFQTFLPLETSNACRSPRHCGFSST